MDIGYIKIAANTDAVTSDAFTLSGEAKIVAYPLAGDEYVVLLEEEPGGTYISAINKDGLSVQLTARQPSQIIVGYGSYKLYKTATATAAAVAAIS